MTERKPTANIKNNSRTPQLECLQFKKSAVRMFLTTDNIQIIKTAVPQLKIPKPWFVKARTNSYLLTFSQNLLKR